VTEERYICDRCVPPVDVTAQVLAERDEQMDVLRTRRRSGKPWSVKIECPHGHEIHVHGTWP
jgi:hypothetical protein